MDSFHQFTRFPTEIKLQVWNECPIEPRRIEIKQGDSQKLEAHAAVPVLLHVNRLSRQVLEPKYVQIMGQTWVNFDIDTIVVDAELLDRFIKRKSLRATKHLVLKCKDNCGFESPCYHNEVPRVKLLESLKSLKTVTIEFEINETDEGCVEMYGNWKFLWLPTILFVFALQNVPYEVRIVNPLQASIGDISKHNWQHIWEEATRLVNENESQMFAIAKVDDLGVTALFI